MIIMKHRLLVLMLVMASQCTAKETPSSSSADICLTGIDDSAITPKFGLLDLISWFLSIKFYLARNDQNQFYNFHHLYGPCDKYLNWSGNKNILDGLAKQLSLRKAASQLHEERSVYKGWFPSAACKESDYLVRQFDGTCNNEKLSAMGSAGTRFGRNVWPVSSKKGRDLLFPNPRMISRKLLERKAGEGPKVHKHLNLLASAWPQAAVHDIQMHATSRSPTDVFKIPLETDDPLAAHGKKYMYVAKSENDSSRLAHEATLPKTFKNHATHWIDGEPMYGKSKKVADSFRTFKNGMMQLDNDGILPLGPDGLPKTGIKDNWWVGLEVFHNLMVKEHNSVASMLSNKHPNWSDQNLYDTARMIIGAMLMKIHITEWAVAMSSHPGKKMATLSSVGQFPTYFKNPAVVKILGTFLPDDAKRVIYGALGREQASNSTGIPHSTSEDISSFYRMHSLLPDNMNFFKLDNSSSMAVNQGMTNLSDTLGTKSHQFFVNNSIGDLLLSFGLNHLPKLTLNNFPAFLQNLETSKGQFVDLGTIDILRDRERELPLYNEYREKLLLQKFDTLNDLTGDSSVIQALEEVYGKDNTIDKVDLLIGMLAEKYPDCHAVGEIGSELLSLEGLSFVAKDSFYTNKFTEAVYSKEGIDWVKNNRLKDVILRHAPELKSTGLKDIDNAFFFWG